MIRNAFVHVPKTGGLRFEPQIKLCERNERHFHCSVDFFLKHNHEHNFLTLVRDPYDVAASAFYFLRGKDFFAKFNSRNPSDSFHARIAHAENATVEDFLYNWEQNSLYSYYYGGRGPEFFNFVGSTDKLHESSLLIHKMFGIETNNGPYNRNRTKEIGEPYQTGYSRLTFMKDHEKDYQIYFEYLNRFYELCKEYKVHNP